MEALFVANDLDGDVTLLLVIETLNNIAKRSVAKSPKHLVSVRNVVVVDNTVSLLVVVVAVVVGCAAAVERAR